MIPLRFITLDVPLASLCNTIGHSGLDHRTLVYFSDFPWRLAQLRIQADSGCCAPTNAPPVSLKAR